MADFLKVFVPAFLLFAAVGAVAGYGARADTAGMKLYAGLEVTQRDGQYVLEFHCAEAGWRYHYDVDTNTGRRTGSTSSLLTLQATALGTPSARHLDYPDLLSVFLGGATA